MKNTCLIAAIYLAITIIVQARIHELSLQDDNREQITISTYGFLKNGLLQVNVKKLEFNPLFKLESIRNSFAFILEKTKNNGFSSFSANDKKQDYCSVIKNRKNKPFKQSILTDSLILNNKQKRPFVSPYELNNNGEHSYSLIVFHLDLVQKNIELIRIGPDLKNLRVNSQLIGKYGYGLKSDVSKNTRKLSSVSNSTKDDINDVDILISDKFDNTGLEDLYEDRGLLKTIDFNVSNSSLSFTFEMNVKNTNEEGLYILSFFNCFKPLASDLKKRKENQNLYFEYNQYNNIKFGVNLDIDILERNEDSFLSAGEIPSPTLYLTWSIIYFLAGISWVSILKGSKGQVYKIHYLMTALVFVKSISLTFHAINIHYIAVNGTQEAVWAILYYITYVLRGLLLIISILLVGTGFSVIKHILSENERRLFVVIIPLQTLAIIAYIFLEEKEQGNADYTTWRQIFFLLDLICCGAILFPVVWSIRHLEAASRTDGKMVFNLKKLQIFKHFYIMIIFYIYFTRIIGFLLKQMLPFRYEWFDELSMEVFTFTFFALTAYKFQPTANNPYLRVGEDDLDMDDIQQLLNENEGNNNNNNNNIDENIDTVFDLIEQDYYVSGATGSDDDHNNMANLQPSGPDSKNPTLMSRSKTNK